MSSTLSGQVAAGSRVKRSALGTPGRLGVLLWTLLLITLASDGLWAPACAAGVALNLLLYPRSWRRLLQWRWLFFAGVVLVPATLWGGEPKLHLGWIALSGPGFVAALRMLARALAVILAVDGFAGAVDISEVAWLFERAGLRGLGFSLGVAVNLLPSLARSSQLAWHSLRMRGGLRAQWWRGLRLLLVTVIANALRRGEEIAVAAEARGFSIENRRAEPVSAGRFDLPLALLLLATLIVVSLLR